MRWVFKYLKFLKTWQTHPMPMDSAWLDNTTTIGLYVIDALLHTVFYQAMKSTIYASIILSLDVHGWIRVIVKSYGHIFFVFVSVELRVDKRFLYILHVFHPTCTKSLADLSKHWVSLLVLKWRVSKTLSDCKLPFRDVEDHKESTIL